MKNIKLMINEELRKKRQNYIVESFLPLTTVNKNDILQKYVTISVKLLEEGYEPNELDLIFEQGFVDQAKTIGGNALQSVKNSAQSGGIGDMAKQAWNKTNVTDALFGGLTSGLKESIIRSILGYLGIKGVLINDAITFFNQYNVRDILKPFKSEQDCMSFGPKMADGIIEVLLSHIMGDNKEENSLNPISSGNIKIDARNIISESLRQSNTGEIISEKFCKGVLWK